VDLRNFSCSMLVPRCLKQALSELQHFKAIGNYMGDMQKMAEFLSESMYLYDSADIQKQDKTTVRDQINTVRKNKQAQNAVTRWRKFTDEKRIPRYTEEWIELNWRNLLFIYLSKFFQSWSSFVRAHTLSCAPATQHKFCPRNITFVTSSHRRWGTGD